MLSWLRYFSFSLSGFPRSLGLSVRLVGVWSLSAEEAQEAVQSDVLHAEDLRKKDRPTSFITTKADNG